MIKDKIAEVTHWGNIQGSWDNIEVIIQKRYNRFWFISYRYWKAYFRLKIKQLKEIEA